MNLIEALQYLKAGYKVKRKGWEDGLYYFRKAGSILVHLPNGEENECRIFLGEGVFSNDQYELYIEPVLDAEEKEYLENFIRPFKHKIKYISKRKPEYYSYIHIELKRYGSFNLPEFCNVNMYKGMEVNKQYSLRDLGLFETKDKKVGE